MTDDKREQIINLVNAALAEVGQAAGITIKEIREAYYDYSGTASELSRKAALVGIGAIWVFRDSAAAGGLGLAPPLLTAGALLIVSIGLDLLQYVCAAGTWGWFGRKIERQLRDSEDQFLAPRWINWPAILFFWLKSIATLAGLAVLATDLARRA